jgi:hypothetical protein
VGWKSVRSSSRSPAISRTPCVAQLGEQPEQLRPAELDVRAAAQHEVAAQHVAFQRPGGQQLGAPAQPGPQPLQRHRCS